VSSDIEVLVVSFNSSSVIGECLNSIARTVPEARVAIREHGIDNAAFEELLRLSTARELTVRVERDLSNPGFGAGCNALARGSDARWLLFLNPDAVIVEWPWSDDVLPPRGSVIGPTYVDSGPPGAYRGRSYRIRDEIARSWLRQNGPPPDGVGFVSGAAMLIDAEAFRAIGGFDEAYFLFYEDIDLCLRAGTAGIETRIEPGWVVRHRGAHSTRPLFSKSLMWSYESGVQFHARRGSSPTLYRIYVVVDAALRALVHGVRQDRPSSSAYAALASRATRDLGNRLRSIARRSGEAGHPQP